MGQHLGNIGPYELREELGRGAMARVWRAWDPNLEREVAIKVPLFDPNLPSGVLEEMGRRFVAEGRVAAKLSHPGIVTVYAADVWDGVQAIVMELVEGSTLTKLLSAGPLSPASVISILDQLLDAVGYAHARGVVHRDIKPDNIFISANGVVKLADFGIAHINNTPTVHATRTGAILGTPGYMSPEQACGAAVDGRSDLFAVGVIAHEMLTGCNPFGAGTDADPTTIIYRIVHEPVPELPDTIAQALPADIRPAIMSALSKNPADRPATAGDFKLMLHGMLVSPTHQATPGTVISKSAISWNTTTQEALAGSAGTVAEDGSGKKLGGKPAWIPYALVGIVCTAVLVIALLSATGGFGGGSGKVGTNPLTYLSLQDGYVAIYTSSSTEPYEVTDVLATSLSPEDQAQLASHVSVSSIDEAKQLVQQYRQMAASTTASGTEDESTPKEQPSEPAPEESFPRSWSGTFGGASHTGSIVDKEIDITLSQVDGDGYLSGICTVGAHETDPNEGTGSYNLEGYIDWSTNKIELYGTTWADQGGLTLMRNFEGAYDPSTDTIVGTSKLPDGSRGSVWRMSAN